jgi:hypothetical protein
MAETRKWLGHGGNGSDSLAQDTYPAASFLILIARFAILKHDLKSVTPMHHAMSMGSRATSAGAGLAGGGRRDAEQGLRP